MKKVISLLITLCMLLSLASCAFYSTPKATPEPTPELIPEPIPALTPKSTLVTTSETEPVTISETTPVITPETTPATAPVTTEKSTPVTTPVTTEKPTPMTTPVTTEKPTPVTTPIATEKPTPVTTPVTALPPASVEFQTYNTIAPYWDNLVRGLIHIEDRYLVEHPSDRTISLGEAYYITYNVILNKPWHKPSYNSQTFLDPDSDECKNAYFEPASNLAYYRYGSSKLSDDDLKKSITKVDLAITLASISEKWFEVVYPAKIEIKSELLDDLNGLNEQELYYVTKAINLGLIENSSDDFKQVPITQEEFEKVLVQFSMKFTTFAPDNRYRRGSNRFNLVTDPSLFPSNYTWYPYILDNTPKEVYEYRGCYAPYNYTPSSGFTESKASPNHLYGIYSRYIDESYINIEDFFDIILNIDYRTINTEKFIDKLHTYLLYCVYDDYGDDGQIYVNMLTEYVEYIKENKIVMSGKATPLFPCLYENDSALMTFVKCKLEVNIISSDIENPKLCFFGKYMLGTDNDSVRYAEVSVGSILERPELKIYIPPFTDGLV